MFLPILIVCSLNVAFIGDTDSGATCVKFFDAQPGHYRTLEQCGTRLRVIYEEVASDPEQLHLKLPGPWRFKGQCSVAIIDETRQA